MIDCCPNPEFVALVAHKSLQFIKVSDFWDFFRLRGISEGMSSFSNPVHDAGVVNLGDSFDTAQSHAIEIHLDAQLLNFI